MKNDYVINGEVVTVYVTRRDGYKYEVKLDLDIFNELNSSITIKQYGQLLYAVVVISGKHHYLHRYIAQTLGSKVCRPLDGNCLNVCRSNLISEDRSIKPYYEIINNEVKVFLPKNNTVHILLLDLHIWEKYSAYYIRPCIHGNFYSARIYINGKEYAIYRVILNAPDNMQVDHINNNPLDNRLCNLRLCTNAENQQNKIINKNNTSGCPGVSFDKTRHKWTTQPMLNGIRYKLGYYDNLDEAIAIVKNFRANHMPFSKEYSLV